MKIIILTSSRWGTAAHHLPYLLQIKSCEVAMVIFSRGKISDKGKHYFKKFKKILSVGILGAINGIRMRKWYNENTAKYAGTVDLKDTCEQSKIPFFEVETINSEKTISLFKQANADVGISMDNGYIGKKIFSVPKFGMLNIHHEILPEYQNAQSVIWQLYNNSSFTGYTIHKIDRQIDTGEILFQEKIPIIFKNTLADTVAHTSAVLLKSSAKGLLYVMEHFEQLQKNAKPQNEEKKYFTPNIFQFLKIYRNYRKLRNS